jgi:flagellar motor switch protein FliN
MSVEFGPVHSMPSDELEPASLLDTPLRVWVEIGRTEMPAASVVGMPEGAILDLDREADDPADLFVNGRHFGTGRLILVEGEWALRIETLDDDADDADDEDGEDGEEVEHSSSAGQDNPEASD